MAFRGGIDVRGGLPFVPRLLMVPPARRWAASSLPVRESPAEFREQLTARTLDEAVSMALRPDRASSYNTVFAHRDGRVVNVEGSATDAEITRPSAAGTLAHTNHYACDRMRRYEGDPDYARRSAVRLGRALELLDGSLGEGPAPGSIGPEQLASFLADHATSPSICRHGDGVESSATAFWCLADVTAGEIGYGRGPRCRGEEARYRFA